MIKKEDIVEIGKFQKTHALKGELNALLDVEPDYAFDGNPLIVSVDGIFVPFYPESVRPKGSESYLVKLRDIDSQQDAAMFVNKAIYGLRSDLADYFDDPDAELTADFVGFRIVDSSLGEIGTVTDIDDGDTVYIPVAEEFIDAIDDDRQVIETTLPDGLVDLNAKKA